MSKYTTRAVRNSTALMLFIILLSLFLISCRDKEVLLSLEELSAYRIVRPDEALGGEDKAAVALKKAILEKTGADIELTTDWVKKSEDIPTGGKEILVGLTNRAVSLQQFERLKTNRTNNSRDYIVKADGETIVILALNADSLAQAVDWFVSAHITDSGLQYPEGLDYLYEFSYPEYKLGDESLYDYTLIVPKDATLYQSAAAKSLSAVFEGLTGSPLTVADDSSPASDKEIVFGATSRSSSEDAAAGEYRIRADGGNLYMSGDYLSQGAAVTYLAGLLKTDGVIPSDIDITGKAEDMMKDNSKLEFNPSDYASVSGIKPIKFLIDDLMMISSGWDYDGRGGDAEENIRYSNSNFFSYRLHDISTTESTSLSRSFQPQSEGMLTLELCATIEGDDGFELSLTSEEGDKAVSLSLEKGKWYASDGSERKVLDAVAAYDTRMLISIDIEKRVFNVIFNGTSLASCKFPESFSGSLSHLILSTGKENTLTISPYIVRLYSGYGIAERFITTPAGKSPDPSNWTINSGEAVVRELANNTSADKNSLELKAQSGTVTVSAGKNLFDGKVYAEMRFMMPRVAGKAVLNLIASLQLDTVSSLTVDNSGIYCGSVFLRSWMPNIWYTLRIEADTRTQKVRILINGKDYGEFHFSLATKYIENVSISFTPNSPEDVMYVDDIYFSAQDEPEDYVPAPLSSGSNGYYVGAQVCSLWRNGYHIGWDAISPYKELKPVLGYYDEGLAEVADWEIKYMAEHGIDYQLYCWYAPTATAPIKSPSMGEALHDGYFNARYTDKMKFAIMWENANAIHPSSSQEFRDYIVPFWVEYYLTDKRYMTVDNKPVITVFSHSALIEDFGGVENVKKEFDYLRQVCVDLGYDGAIIMVQAATTDKSVMDTIAAMGADSVYAYNWGKSNTAEEYINYVSGQDAAFTPGATPTISVGFNNVGWAGTRSGLISFEDYNKALSWAKDTFLPTKEDWRSKMIILSTWNEYGEGTYIMPTEEYGFGYIDTVRELFAPDSKYENLIPTEKQLARLCGLYPQERALLRPGYNHGDALLPQNVLKGWSFAEPSSKGQWSAAFSVDGFAIKDGAMSGSSKQSDFAVVSKDNLNIDISTVTYIKVRMKSSAAGSAQMFFITNADTSWDEAKAMSVNIPGGVTTDLYFNMSLKNGWTGTLKQLRFDPLGGPCEFWIESIELLYPDKSVSLTVDGTEIDIKQHPLIEEGGETLIPYNPQKGLAERMGVSYSWDAVSKTITFKRGDKSAAFTVGSEKTVINGKDMSLSTAVGEYDALPTLPLRVLAEALGCSYKESAEKIEIFTK